MLLFLLFRDSLSCCVLVPDSIHCMSNGINEKSFVVFFYPSFTIFSSFSDWYKFTFLYRNRVKPFVISDIQFSTQSSFSICNLFEFWWKSIFTASIESFRLIQKLANNWKYCNVRTKMEKNEKKKKIYFISKSKSNFAFNRREEFCL